MRLIDVDKVNSEIDRLCEEYESQYYEGTVYAEGYKNACSKIKRILDSISEEKEGDLDFQRFAKEMSDNIYTLPSSETKNTEENPLSWEYAIAKHFYNLGLNSKQDESPKIKGWVARDKDGHLFVYNEKPHKSGLGWYSEDVIELIDSETFPEIKWEDEEPVEVELTVKAI